jgi:hypothetical protein
VVEDAEALVDVAVRRGERGHVLRVPAAQDLRGGPRLGIAARRLLRTVVDVIAQDRPVEPRSVQGSIPGLALLGPLLGPLLGLQLCHGRDGEVHLGAALRCGFPPSQESGRARGGGAVGAAPAAPPDQHHEQQGHGPAEQERGPRVPVPVVPAPPPDPGERGAAVDPPSVAGADGSGSATRLEVTCLEVCVSS